mgnify:CR=1 FL=1
MAARGTGGRRRARRALSAGATLALALHAPAGPLAAQGSDRACGDVVATAQRGTWRAELRLAIRIADSDRPLPRPAADYVLDAIRQHLVLPPALGTDTWLAGGDSTGYAVLVSRLYVELGRDDGRVRKLGALVRSGSPDLDAAFARAVRAADTAQAIGPIPELTDRSVLPAVLDLTTISSAAIAVAEPASIAVGALELPVVRRFAAARPLARPWVRLGEDAKQVGGELSLDYVVDRDGTVAPTSTDVRLFSSEAFVGQVLRAMPLWRHEPARIAGCPVRQFTWQRTGVYVSPVR